MTVVEVVPLAAGSAPIVVGRGVVGAVVGVLGLLVEGAGLSVLDERLGVEVGRLLAVKSGAHLDCKAEAGRSATARYPQQPLCFTCKADQLQSHKNQALYCCTTQFEGTLSAQQSGYYSINN